MPDPAYQSLPFEEAIRFFRAKVNVPTRRWADIWREAHDKAFMVAGAMQADLIEDFRQAVDRARAQGTTLAQFRKDFDRIVAAHGWSYKGSRGWRSRIIYETNLRTSYQAGRYAQLTRPAALRTNPYWRYQHSDSVTQPRPLHVSWDGLILRHDDPWWQAHFPPNGWGCKCRVFAVSRRELRRRGKRGPDRAPDNGTYEWVDKATGQIHDIPNGIDPGWDYTPGRSVSGLARRQIRAKARRLPRPLRQAVEQTTEQIPPAPAPPDITPRSETFSTVRGIDQDGLTQALTRLGQSAPQLEALQRFLEAHPVKTLVLKQNETGKGNTAWRLRQLIADFLGVSSAWGRYNTRNPKYTKGFTSRAWDHIVLKAGARQKAARIRPEPLRQAVADAAEKHRLGHPVWSISEAVDDSDSALLSTWLHEMGHQIHFWAGDPAPPAGAASLTQYSLTNRREWHAEHLAAWFLDREALAGWSREVAEYLDGLVERAITSNRKGA